MIAKNRRNYNLLSNGSGKQEILTAAKEEWMKWK